MTTPATVDLCVRALPPGATAWGGRTSRAHEADSGYGGSMDDLKNDAFIEAKSRLSNDQVMAIVTERELFLAGELGHELESLGATREQKSAPDGEARRWMLTSEFRDFLKRTT